MSVSQKIKIGGVHALEVSGALKIYGDVTALKHVDLTVECGEFFGLLGPNGAGKTTLISAIVGLCKMTSGTIRVFDYSVGQDHLASRYFVGYSPQEVNLDRFFSISKILEYQAGFFGVSRAARKNRVSELLEQFELTEKANVQYYKLSGGMQKRVLIAKALVSSPQLLILDEPTAGVDVKLRHDLWKYLRKVNESGVTIILTTHYIDEAEELCNRIGIINHGQIREIDSPRNLIQKYCVPFVKITLGSEMPSDVFQNLPFQVERNGLQIKATGSSPAMMIEEIVSRIAKNSGCVIKDISIDAGSLEQVFLSVTGEALHSEGPA